MGEGRHLSGARAVQEDGQPRFSRAEQAGRVRRLGPRLLQCADDGGGAWRDHLRRRADGDRGADRHGDAGAGAVRLGRGAARVSQPLDLRRLRRLQRRLRARRGLGCCLDQDPCALRWRRLRHQWRQDVDHQRHPGRLDLPARQYRRWACSPQQVAELRAHEERGCHGRTKTRRDGHALVRHCADLLRQCPRAQAQPDRRGGQGLHLPDDPVPGGAAVGRGRLPQGTRIHHQRDHRIHSQPQGVREVDPRQPGRALQACGDADRGRAVTRADLSCRRGAGGGRGCDQACDHGQAESRPAWPRAHRRLLAILGRNGLYQRDAGQPRLSRQPPDLDRRRRRRGHADGPVQDDGDAARQLVYCFEHDLFGKPLHTFPDDARGKCLMITLYHCDAARSFRPLWMLEEMGLPYELKMLPFPPRVFAKEYLGINPLGTIPFMIDGEARMTESSGICHYLGIKHGPTPLMVGPDDPAYGAFLNWMYFSDATLTFPQTLVLRYTQLEPEERRNPQVAGDYAKWFLGRLRAVEAATANTEALCVGRFTAADIVIGYALRLADNIGLAKDFGPNVAAYWARLQQRDGFKRAVAAEQKAGVEQNIAPRVRA